MSLERYKKMNAYEEKKKLDESILAAFKRFDAAAKRCDEALAKFDKHVDEFYRTNFYQIKRKGE
jgi:exonuclease VII small subunit